LGEAGILVYAAPHVPASVLTQAQSETGKNAVKSAKMDRAATAVSDGSKIDTSTTDNASMHYGQIKAVVTAGSLKPSVWGIQAAEGLWFGATCNSLIHRAGHGWRAY
jgi:hypothetical protein